VAISSPQIDRTLVFDAATGGLVIEVCPFRCRDPGFRGTDRHIALSSGGEVLLVSGAEGHAAWDASTGAFLFALDNPDRHDRAAPKSKR
jgi:hypothetical protein